MKVTKQTITKMIKEEMEALLNEARPPRASSPPMEYAARDLSGLGPGTRQLRESKLHPLQALILQETQNVLREIIHAAKQRKK